MKWVLIIVISLVALVLAVWVIGSVYRKGRPVARTIRMKQSTDAVWAVITDSQAMPAWRPNVVKVERLADQNGHAVWRETYKDGQTLPLEMVESQPPKRLVARIADPKLPFGGAWTYEITPAEGGCPIAITERGEVYNPVFRLVSRFMNQTGTISIYLNGLASQF